MTTEAEHLEVKLAERPDSGAVAAQEVVLSGSKRGAKWALAFPEPLDNTKNNDETSMPEAFQNASKTPKP